MEAEGNHVGKGELAEVAQALCQQEGDDRPADQPADREDQAVEAVGEHQARNTQERSGRHIVARNRQAVLETGNPTTGGVEVGSRLRLACSPLGDVQGERNENTEHGNRSPVRGLLGSVTQICTSGQRCTTQEKRTQRNKRLIHLGHF